MLKKRCLLTLKATKLFFSALIFTGALLIAGLFLIVKRKDPSPVSFTKPSQYDFRKTNTLEKPAQTVVAVSDGGSSPVTVESGLYQNIPAEDKAKLAVIDQQLKLKNDNDLRMDRDLKYLSPTLHGIIFEKYETIPAEDRNGKGLLTYLIARDLKSNEDVQFLKKVYQETPCLSLSDCKALNPVENSHHAGVDQTTLVYPQLAGLYRLEQSLTEKPELLNISNYRNGVVQILIQAENFPVPVVHEKARAIREHFSL